MNSMKPGAFGAAAVVYATIFSMAACGDGTGPNRSAQVGVGFQMARTSTMAANVTSADGTPVTGAPPTVTTTAAGTAIVRGTDTLLITSAQLVVRDVKLRAVSAVCTDDDDVVSANVLGTSLSLDGKSSSKSGESEDDECPVIRVGPYLVDVPVNGTTGAFIAVPVPEGTYSAVRLTLHKVTSSDSADLAFRQAFPDFRDISVRLVGVYDGVPFVFVNDVNAKINVGLTDPVTIKPGGDNITVSVDFSSWFVRPQGGLYSPAQANTPGSVRAAVQNNIRAAFRAFRDKDRDGRED